MDGSSELAVVALFKAGADSDAEDPKDRYTSMLKANNYSGLSVPCLSFQFQLDHLRQCLARPEKYSGLILTSPRSVEAVKEAVDILPDGWKEKRHYCVGVQTRDTAIRLLGDLPHLTGEQCGNAVNLSEVIFKELPGGGPPLLFPCSSLKMDILPRILKEHDIAMECITSYVTVAHPKLEQAVFKLSHNAPHCLVFYSPSGVNFTLPFLRKYDLLKGVKVVSIGNTTAHALKENNIAVDQICAKPTPDNLIEALGNIFC